MVGATHVQSNRCTELPQAKEPRHATDEGKASFNQTTSNNAKTAKPPKWFGGLLPHSAPRQRGTALPSLSGSGRVLRGKAAHNGCSPGKQRPPPCPDNSQSTTGTGGRRGKRWSHARQGRTPYANLTPGGPVTAEMATGPADGGSDPAHRQEAAELDHRDMYSLALAVEKALDALFAERHRHAARRSAPAGVHRAARPGRLRPAATLYLVETGRAAGCGGSG